LTKLHIPGTSPPELILKITHRARSQGVFNHKRARSSSTGRQESPGKLTCCVQSKCSVMTGSHQAQPVLESPESCRSSEGSFLLRDHQVISEACTVGCGFPATAQSQRLHNRMPSLRSQAWALVPLDTRVTLGTYTNYCTHNREAGAGALQMASIHPLVAKCGKACQGETGSWDLWGPGGSR
jgi:hypothetical protein